MKHPIQISLTCLVIFISLVAGCAKKSQPVTTPPPPPPVSPTPTPAPTPSPTPTPTPTPTADGWIDATKSPFTVRGIVEGFYGTPWTQQQRLSAFDFMGNVGMNTYVYAPKDDPYQRAEWRKLYPEAELTRFRALLARAKQRGITFVYSISPGLDITYSSQSDRNALDAKVDQLRTLGITTIMFSVDDVDERLSPADAAIYGKDYGAAQADAANWLNTAQRAKEKHFALWMTPSHYTGTKADPYLTTIGLKLDQTIRLLWTGPDVLSERITTADADAFAAIIQRKPIVWDNYPVNDYTYVMKKKPRLILGPLRRRDPNLASHVAGYLLNPMIQAEASKLPLFTAAAYLANPTSYDPDAALQEGARHLTTSNAAASNLLNFSSFALISAVFDTEAPALTQAIANYTAGTATGPASLRQQFEAMSLLPARLEATLPPTLYREIAPWADALHVKGEAGLLALDVDAAVKRKDTATVKAKLPALKSALAAINTQDATAYISFNLVENFLTKVIADAGTPS